MFVCVLPQYSKGYILPPSSLSLGTPLSPLQDLITHLWERPLNTLYVSRPDLELVGLLRSIVANASQSVCQVTTPMGGGGGG